MRIFKNFPYRIITTNQGLFIKTETILKTQADIDNFRIEAINHYNGNCNYYEMVQENSVDDIVAFRNRCIKRGLAHLIKCKTCGSVFFISDTESEWFTSNDLKLPKRCRTCRHKTEPIIKIDTSTVDSEILKK